MYDTQIRYKLFLLGILITLEVGYNGLLHQDYTPSEADNSSQSRASIVPPIDKKPTGGLESGIHMS